MKIVSKFNDYYDRIQAYGIDKQLVFYRKFEFIKYPMLNYYSNHYADPNIREFGGIVGCCGKLYPYLLLVTSNELTKKPGDPTQFSNPIIHYSADTVKPLLKTSWGYRGSVDFPNIHPKMYDIFETYDTPTFTLNDFHFNPKTLASNTTAANNNPTRTGAGLYINPPLADHSFQKVMSAEVIFQEISQYLGRDKLTAEDSIPVTDIVKTERAGFDKKTSFRKRKSTNGENT